ncbi:hypothetical protein ACFZB9_05475 [Kitasatospora sp. NPDC008050]|uniref:hypothetical protein n=1 Tax=Kitasatospora sp. NPDC008050 TaxID=3364021 RepID=UPI0036EC5A6F
MADNNTPIALPEQADEADSALTSAIQATEQAADQHVESGNGAAAPVATPATKSVQDADGGTVQPLGSVVSTH